MNNLIEKQAGKIGENSKPPGRPRVYENQAVRQKAYRDRLKAKGLREVKQWVKDVRDTDKVLTSEVIDLSMMKRKS